MRLFLVHHGEAAGPDVDPVRPLTASGREHVERLAREAAARGVRPDAIWHSGKLRARQTAEAFWRACNPFAQMTAVRDLQPDDPAQRIADRLEGESQDLLIAGHFPHLPRLLALLVGSAAGEAASFPPHGLVALEANDEAPKVWREVWRLE